MVQMTDESLMSIFIRMYFNEILVSVGTAFLVNSKSGSPLLITNRHNVTGKHNETGALLSPKTGLVPNRIEIYHNRLGERGAHIIKSEELLLDEFDPKWIEHPTWGPKVDFVAIPLTDLEDVAIYAYTLDMGRDIFLGVTGTVSVVGFPFGIQVGNNAAVWATGTVASEPEIDYRGLPLFLIDCRSRGGQSGSPVIAYRSGGSVVNMIGGGGAVWPGPVKKFVGIYSGRVNPESDLGMVWKASAINELVDSI
ncbi:trypsin-like peptidase domain-containing protein [Peribacillus sp. S4]|uniref:trypsin-like peptidase domain-containing protein n=1 Tax=Peribacillus sp. S4 TaxID=3384451 RepID=UPI003989547C